MIQSYAFALELNLGFDACAQRAWSKSVDSCVFAHLRVRVCRPCLLNPLSLNQVTGSWTPPVALIIWSVS